MRFLALLPLVAVAVATPSSLYDDGLQIPMVGVGAGDFAGLPMEYPGFDLDLNAVRLVQFEEHDEPVRMTELQKVHVCLSCTTFNPLM